MITEDDLRDTLSAHETLAPDPGPVAARITAGVRTRRRRRHAAAGTALVAVATAAAVAVPTLVLRDPAPPGGTVAASPTARTTTPAAPREIRFDPLTVPFTVRWLPRGWFPDGMTRTAPGSVERSYEDRPGTGSLFVQVYDTRISTRSTTDQAPGGGSVVRRRLGATVWLVVSGTAPEADLNRVLRSVDVRAPAALRFPFHASWLPAGYRVTGATSGFYHWHGTSHGTVAADPPGTDTGVFLDTDLVGDALNVFVGREDGTWEDKGLVPNGTLLGHPSFYREENGSAVLHVYGIDGMHISINAETTGRPELTRATLERIARGIRLVDSPTDPSAWTTDPV